MSVNARTIPAVSIVSTLTGATSVSVSLATKWGRTVTPAKVSICVCV